GSSALPFIDNWLEHGVHEELMRRGKILFVGIERIGHLVLLDESQFGLTTQAEIFDIFHERINLGLREQFERWHGRARDSFVHGSDQGLMRRRRIGSGGLELVHAFAVIARVWLQEKGRRPHAVAGYAVAMDAVQTK